MAGKKNTALTAIRRYLEAKGFPTELAVRRGQKRVIGTEYTASGIADGTIVKLARVVYVHAEDSVTLIEDFRSTIPSPVCGAHSNPLEQKRTASIPTIIDLVQTELKSEVIEITTRYDTLKRPFRTFLKMLVLDKRKMKHVVYCAWADTTHEVEEIRQRMGPTDQNHTCVIVWKETLSAAKVAGAIISQIKHWQRYNWPKPK